ncbi:Nn.00g032060.m01.CDS01 [Neocucurbitaria sp. VM-36]
MASKPPAIRVNSLEIDMAQRTIESLDELLREKAIRHADGGSKVFWPMSVLMEVVTRDRIVQELRRFQQLKGDVSQLIEKIATEYRRVFAILNLVGKEEYIQKFIEDNVKDIFLPLQADDTIQYAISRTDAPKRPLQCFKMLRTSERELFLQYQHQVNPEILGYNRDSGRVQHKDLEPAAILPFTATKAMRNGGYSTVTQVTVHPDCHEFNNVLKPFQIILNDQFALKELLASGTAEEFATELDALKRFFHKHLITLLMSWKINKRYHLLFPLAGSNLEDYWESSSGSRGNRPLDVGMLEWISKQIVGMAGALNAVHEPPQFLQAIPKYGRHGDLKPENVLWYQSEEDPAGILVIADLGLSATHSDKSRSNIPNQGIPGTPGYRPPECDLEGGTISRSYDIWTFGCLLLELTCWALGGEENRQAFEDARESPYITGAITDIFFDVQVKEDGPGYAIMVKRQVREWIRKLHNLPTCTNYFHDLLDLIETKMVITLSQGQNRISSPRLLTTLEQMHKRVIDPMDGYGRQSNPRKQSIREPEPVDANLNIMAKKMVFDRKPALSTHKGWTQKPKSKQELERMA